MAIKQPMITPIAVLSALAFSCSAWVNGAWAAHDERPAPNPIYTKNKQPGRTFRAVSQNPRYASQNHPASAYPSDANPPTNQPIVTSVRHVGLSTVLISSNPHDKNSQPKVYLSPNQVAYTTPPCPPYQAVNVYSTGHSNNYFRQTRVYTNPRPYINHHRPRVAYSCPQPVIVKQSYRRNYRSGINITIRVN